MLVATGSNNLDGLLTLIEYVRDPKKRAKELTELRDERDGLMRERVALERAHGDTKKLAQAADTLALAETAASNILSEANATATELVEAAQRKAGDITQERENITRDVKNFNVKLASFDKTSTAQIVEFERREGRVTKRESDIARMRSDLDQDKIAFRQKAENVQAAWKE